MRTIRELACEAFDVLTSNELSPSTRDLVTVEGIRISGWADAPGEREALLDEILAEYEARARAADNQAAVDEIADVRRAIKSGGDLPTVSLAPKEGRPVAACPRCGSECGVVVLDHGTGREREALVDLAPVSLAPVASRNLAALAVWVELFSGHPPRGQILASGSLHHQHSCRANPSEGRADG